MIRLLTLLKYIGYFLAVTGSAIAIFILFNEVYFNSSLTINSDLASDFGSFFGGFVGTIFAILSVVLLVYTIIAQNIENRKTSLKDNFFKMIDYHNQNVAQISVPNINTEKNNFENGRRAFVVYKIQIKRLLNLVDKINEEDNLKLNQKEIIDIAYIVFYYGLEGSWREFILEKLIRYNNAELIINKIFTEIEENPTIKLGRTNQTNLSTYFRNMYNAIKLIDNSELMNRTEKEELIKIYRAQLSNPELYVLFFNVVSRFGKKWHSRKYILRYEFIKNLPKNYCDGFKPKDFFPIEYEYEEL